MIRVRVTRENGIVSIECVGHSAGDVCRGASMIMQAAALGLRDLAKQYPKQIAFDCYSFGEWTEKIDSLDRRKK